MVTYKVGVEFGSNVGVLARDMASGAQQVRSFGQQATAGLTSASVASDRYALAAQRVEAAELRVAASRERLNTVQAQGAVSTRELAAAQTSFVAAQERLLVAQETQTRVLREQRAVQHSSSGLGIVAGLAGTAVAFKIKDAIEAGARSAANLQAIDRQLASSLASTGDAAGVSIDQIDARSTAISKLTGISEQATRGGALLELTFTGVRNQGAGAAAIFDRTQTAAADMAIGLHLARGGAIDYQAAIQQLSRALNDPVAGMTLLTRSGVSFTGQQKEQIKTLAQTGHMLQAQQLILTLVGQKYGDAAKQYGQTSEGAYAQAREALDQLERRLADPALAAGVPVLHALRDVLDFLVAHPAAVEFGEVAVALSAAAFAAATLERAVAFLKDSQWIQALGRWAFGYQTLGRMEATLAAEEEAHAAVTDTAIGSQAGLAAAYDATAVAADRLATAQATLTGTTAAASVAADTGAVSAAGGGFMGLLARFAGTGTAVRLGTLGAGLATAASAVDPVVLASILASGSDNPKGDKLDATQSQLYKGFTYRNGQFFAGNVPIVDPLTTMVLRSIRDTGPQGNYNYADAAALNKQRPGFIVNPNSGGPQNQTLARQNRLLAAQLTLASQVAVVGVGGLPNVTSQQIQSESSLIGGALPGLTDAPSTVHQNKLAALGSADRAVQLAQARYAAAQRAVTAASGGHVDPNKVIAARDRLSAAENHLLEIRLKHHTTASQIASAEASIATAQARVNTLTDAGSGSTDKLAAAELRLKSAHDSLLSAQDRQAKARQAAGATTALSATDIEHRFAANLKTSQGLDAAQRSLARQGLSQGVIEQLDKLEKEAPGTLQRVARSLTPALIKELNAQVAAQQQAAQDFLVIPFQAAALHAQAIHARIIRALAESDAAAFDKYFGTGAGQGYINRPPSIVGHGRTPAFATGGWVNGTPGQPVPAVVHGGEYVLSRDMLAGRQPIGVQLGATSGVLAAPQIHVHVHTQQPVSVRHETHLHNPKFDDARALDDYQRRARRARAVWN